ncbi:hypothetical protein LT493_25050 [Streptomyces tricolor]|nr:hypothetical protein [Streptomyces tricolor]
MCPAPPGRRPAVALAFGGVTAGAAPGQVPRTRTTTRSPAPESGRAARLLADGFPGLGGGQRHRRLAHRHRHGPPPDIEQSMTRTLRRIAALARRGLGGRPPRRPGHPPDQRRRPRRHYATVTFARQAEDIGPAEAQAVVRTARAAAGEGPRWSLGGSAIGLTEAPRGHTAEVVGVLVAAVVLFPRLLVRSPPRCCRSPPRWSVSAPRTPGSGCSGTS